jgi:hypothetical protein
LSQKAGRLKSPTRVALLCAGYPSLACDNFQVNFIIGEYFLEAFNDIGQPCGNRTVRMCFFIKSTMRALMELQGGPERKIKASFIDNFQGSGIQLQIKNLTSLIVQNKAVLYFYSIRTSI